MEGVGVQCRCTIIRTLPLSYDTEFSEMVISHGKMVTARKDWMILVGSLSGMINVVPPLSWSIYI